MHFYVNGGFEVRGVRTEQEAQAAVDTAMERLILPPGVSFCGPTQATPRQFVGDAEDGICLICNERPADHDDYRCERCYAEGEAEMLAAFGPG